jgi:hypothetical protein
MTYAGQVCILNVGEGDTKLIFDGKDPAETIRCLSDSREYRGISWAL